MKRPVGALTRKQFERKPIKTYFVRSTWSEEEKIGLVAEPKFTHSNTWFNGQYGYFFHNYFHALAYCLKEKAKYESKRHHHQSA